MVQENRIFEETQCERRQKSAATLQAMEALHQDGKPAPAHAGGDRISIFWQFFGGTILSIVALVIITAYNQITTTETDLRRDVSQAQLDLVKKEEINSRLTSIWNSIKELQATKTSLVSLGEQARALDQQVGAQTRHGEEQQRELRRKIEDISQRVQILAERLAAIEARNSTPQDSAQSARGR
jgi:vacuolar-type H+-ATPase subunit I/STV1